MECTPKIETAKKAPEKDIIVPIDQEAYHNFRKCFEKYRELNSEVPARVFKLLLLHDFCFSLFLVIISSADKLKDSTESARNIIKEVYNLADMTPKLSTNDAKAVLNFYLENGKYMPLYDWVKLLPPKTFASNIDSDAEFRLPFPPSEKNDLFDSYTPFLPSITIHSNDLEQFFNDNKQDLKNYFIKRYILTDAIKAAAYTPFYIGIRKLTDNQIHQLKQASSNSIKNSMILYDYYKKAFELSEEVLLDGDIIDMTFGRKGIRRRMKSYFSLEPETHANDPEAAINCIRLAAYLKGTELKYGIHIKRRVRKTLNFHLNSFFSDYLKGSERHPKLAEIYNNIIPDMLHDVRSCCDIDFILICRDAIEAIDEAVTAVFPFRTTPNGNATVFVRDYLPDSALSDIKEIIAGNDTNDVSAATYNVWQEFYMFLNALTKRAQLAKKLDMCSFDDIINDLCARHEMLQVSNLINIGVLFTKSSEDYTKIYTSKKEALITVPSDPAEEYIKDLMMVRALDHYIDFSDFLLMYRESVVDFLCAKDDSVNKKKLQRRIKENLSNIIYLITNIYGKRVNALDVFLCFYLYFSMSGISIRQNGYQSHDKKTIVTIINNEELSVDDINVLRLVLQRLKCIVLLGKEIEPQRNHYAETAILAYFSEQLHDYDLITASINIVRLMKRIDSYRNKP